MILLLAIAIPWIVLAVPRDPDESRYLEIPREMLQNGDWLVPRLNGLPYLEKPPLYFWVMAATFHVFGAGELPARFVSCFCAAGMVILTSLIATSAAGGGAGARAGVILASSPFPAAMASIITIDPMFSFLITAAMAGFFHGASPASRPGTRARLMLLLGYACLGLAVLTKGPIALVFPALGWACHRCFRRGGPLLPPAFGRGSLIILGISLPWFVAVSWKFPSFPRYFLVDHHFGRLLGTDVPSVRYHGKSLLFFLPVLLGGAFPWSLFLAAPWSFLRQEWRMEPLARFAWCWLLPALLFLSLSSGKLPTYVLPLFPPLALLAARRWEQIATGVLPWRFGLAISLSALGLVIIASMVVVVLITVRTDDSYLMALDRRLVALFVALAVLFPAASYAGLRANSLRRGFGSLALMAVPVMLLGALFKVSLDRAASTEALAIRLKDLRSPGDVVVCAGEYLPLISFRLGEPICVYGTDADLDFGAAQPGWRSDHLLEVDRLRMLLGGPDRVFLIVREKKRARLLSRIGIDLNVIAQEGKHALLSNAAQLPPPRTNVSPAG